MSALPTGTVTFLFTDIERSTELVNTLGERYPAVLARHHALLREAVRAHSGIELMTEGDAFFVVFRSPLDAVRAVIDAQRALHAESWPEGGDVRVRMGVHTGEAVLGGDNYLGLDVHRASRISGAGHGGQVLLSDATRALVQQALPDGAALRDLGPHRLKGLPEPERLFQLVVEDLPSSFPPLNSLEARANNLPAPVTSFIGREHQIAEIRQRLGSTRLLTLTGPGGTGKTRLSIRVAEEMLADFEHGCWFVALDSLRDPELVPSAIASSLHVTVPADRPVMDALGTWLAERQLLLLLDNFEQVTPAASHVGQLLTTAPRLRVLATSRTPLHIYGEQEYQVPPLASAAELKHAANVSPEALSQYEAVQLFIERALAVKPDFRVTNENAPAVAELCARLDGLPLAIELAAARVKLLTPEQMLARLERSLSLLASSAQNLPERQRTLRGAIEWSHEMLSPAERRLFAALSIFRGGFTLEAADEVCGSEAGVDVFEGVASLVDKSLVESETLGPETRFSMLETIGEYARERLAESDEAEVVRRRHAAYYFALAMDSAAGLRGARQLESLAHLEREHDNLRAAFRRAQEIGMVDEAQRAAGAIWRFWQQRGHFAEARVIVERLLDSPSSPGARAAALTAAGSIAYWQGDYEAMSDHYAEARQLYESIGDLPGLAEAVYNQSYVPFLRGDLAEANRLIEEAGRLYRQVGDELGAAETELMRGFANYFAGNLEAALPPAERAIELYRAAGDPWRLADTLTGVAFLHASAGDWQRSIAEARESLALFEELNNEVGLTMAFETLGSVAAWVGDLERAAKLLSLAAVTKERVGGQAPSQIFPTQPQREMVRRALGDQRYDELVSVGASLPIAEGIRLAREFEAPIGAPPLAPVEQWADLADVGKAAEPSPSE